ncbi:MAG: VC0807 family protein, partial [Hydrogenophaga sp.]
MDLLVSLLIPSLILMKFSGEAQLGADKALVLALAFPLGWGLFELIRYRKFNFIALLGLISVLLTGGIGLLKLDNQWLAVKEAAVPGLIGIAVLVSTFTPYPLIRTLMFNKSLVNVDKIHERLESSGNTH